MKATHLAYLALLLLGCSSHDMNNHKKTYMKLSIWNGNNNNVVKYFNGDKIIKEINYLDDKHRLADSTRYIYSDDKLIYKIYYDLSDLRLQDNISPDTVKYVYIDNSLSLEYSNSINRQFTHLYYYDKSGNMSRKIILCGDQYFNIEYKDSIISTTIVDKNFLGELVTNTYQEEWYRNEYLDSVLKKDRLNLYNNIPFDAFHYYPITCSKTESGKIVQKVSIPEDSDFRFYDTFINRDPLLDSIKLVLDDYKISEMYIYYNDNTCGITSYKYSLQDLIIEERFGPIDKPYSKKKYVYEFTSQIE